jgi:DNA-nicking Smr family endonuclease
VKAKPDEQDSALFREAIRGVKPLRHVARVTGDPPRPRARARFARAERHLVLEDIPHDPRDAPELAPGDASSFARAGVPPTLLRRLRRGEFRVQAELDLHGLNANDAKRQLCAFLITSLQRNVRCLRIVHGKGLRSGANGPVLRLLVNRILSHTTQVLAYASARQGDGGTGALYVLLAATHASSAST